ncbi:MAG: DUF3866 family protein [Coriobacteriales bacterium]|jgi:hypothetical protein|nr:DUF3866 family protein [Coriobacteriales bacterium]
MRLLIAQVIEAQPPQHGVQHLAVECAEGEDAGHEREAHAAPAEGGRPARAASVRAVRYEAVRYEALAPLCEAGDRVLVNTTALDLGLGTGGVCFVVANLTAAERSGPVAFDDASDCGGDDTCGDTDGDAPASAKRTSLSGHIIKLRYTPFQHEVLSVEEDASPHHEAMKHACSLAGAPVVCCELHSQVPLVAAAVKHADPGARIVYCMTDEAALLAAFSRILVRMRETGLLDACITCGQAFGGDLEAVNVYSGLLAAVAVGKADVVLCSQGPGIVGTATRFGHGGLAQAQALNAVAVLDGVPIAPLRLSFADARSRQRGVSHHTLTALGTACLARALVPLPDDLLREQATTAARQLEEAGILDRHRLVDVPLPSEAIDLRGLKVTTMGRAQADDPAFFSAAFAAGMLAARLAGGPADGPAGEKARA